jgi:hypothetical protein
VLVVSRGVIPGPSQRARPEVAGPMTGSARSPESIAPAFAAMDSRLAASRRPGTKNEV